VGPVLILAVSPRRHIRLLFAMILALGVQSSYANPAATSAELRALACCAGHCDKPMPSPASRGCCGLTAMPSGPAVTPAAPAGGPVGFLVSLPALTTLAPPESARLVLHDVQPRGSGPPTFLAQRHLLI
jgi:hypothetical protein